MGFIEEVRTRLISAGIVTTTNFFKGPKAAIPTGNGPYVQMSQTGGQGNQLTQDDAIGYSKPSAQIIVTASDPTVAEDKAKAIRANLMVVRNVTLSGTWYQEITADQEVFDFPLDEAAGRPRSGFNISAVKRPS